MKKLKIEECQEIVFESMLYFRSIIRIEEVTRLNNKVKEFLTTNGFVMSPISISSIKNAKTLTTNMEEIDYEYMLPVEKPFKDTTDFRYIKEFKLSNVIKCNYDGPKITNSELSKKLDIYIKAHDLIVISDAYYLINSKKNWNHKGLAVEIYLQVATLST